MTIQNTPLKDCFIVEPKVFKDDRGYFFESHSDIKGKGTVLEKYEWIQENESKSVKGVLRGLAHGFVVVSDIAIFSYKCDNHYYPEHDSGIIYNDRDLDIPWPQLDVPFQLSVKDQVLKTISEAYKF